MAREERAFERKPDLWRGFETPKREPHERSLFPKGNGVGFSKARREKGRKTNPRRADTSLVFNGTQATGNSLRTVSLNNHGTLA